MVILRYSSQPPNYHNQNNFNVYQGSDSGELTGQEMSQIAMSYGLVQMFWHQMVIPKQTCAIVERELISHEIRSSKELMSTNELRKSTLLVPSRKHKIKSR